VVVSLEQIYLVPEFGQLRRRSNSGKAGADDQCVRGVVFRHACKTKVFWRLFNEECKEIF
jgi:hypothetical protein